MSIYIPYFYIIQDVHNGMYYAGSRYSKKANPSELLTETGYKTHSKKVREIIRKYGLKSFIIRKIRTFESSEQAYDYESRFLQRIDARNNHRFYNSHNNDGVGFSDPNHRKVVGPDGLTSYQRGARKATETKSNTVINGMNLHQISYYKALENNPNLNKIRSKRSVETLSKINPKTGLSKYQEIGLKKRGDNNPSKKQENARKISIARKESIARNKEEWLRKQEKLNNYLSTHKDENGLTARDKHSIWMKENNPTRGTKWFNNGKKNMRIKEGENIPEGFSPGRIRVNAP